MEEENDGRGEVAVAVGGVEEMPVPPGVGNAKCKGAGGPSNNIITTMYGMEVVDYFI